jgi:hypothetical protein
MYRRRATTLFKRYARAHLMGDEAPLSVIDARFHARRPSPRDFVCRIEVAMSSSIILQETDKILRGVGRKAPLRASMRHHALAMHLKLTSRDLAAYTASGGIAEFPRRVVLILAWMR